MQNINLELFSRLFFLNLSNSIKIDENFSLVSDASPSPSNQSALEPPTPPRTPITPQNHQQRIYNNNNDDSKENFQGQSPIKSLLLQKSLKNENEDFEEDSTNYSDDGMGGRSSAMNLTSVADDSDHEESDCASSFENSRLSLRNVDNLLDKTTMVS